jgi:hypothetical protein
VKKSGALWYDARGLFEKSATVMRSSILNLKDE